MNYEYLVIGAGLYGAVFAPKAKKYDNKLFIIDKRTHILGNVYTEEVEGINVYKYGAHIFYTSNKKLGDKEQKVIFGGRLGEYKYYDMDAVITSALKICNQVL